jgi:hypothetical protein
VTASHGKGAHHKGTGLRGGGSPTTTNVRLCADQSFMQRACTLHGDKGTTLRQAAVHNILGQIVSGKTRRMLGSRPATQNTGREVRRTCATRFSRRETTASCLGPRKVPVDVRICESTLLPVLLSATDDLRMLGFASAIR